MPIKEVDVITLDEELRRMKSLKKQAVYSIFYFPNLVLQRPILNIMSGIVAEKALGRKLIRTCTDVAADAYNGEKIDRRYSGYGGTTDLTPG